MLRTTLVFGLLAPALLRAAAFDDDQAAPTAKQLGALFSANCASCHQAPDTSFAVDRAWITQLADTA